MNTNGIAVNPNQYQWPQAPYFANYGQVQPPYIPPVQPTRPQTVQPSTQMANTMNYISGRAVNGPDEITPQEIPMDGTLSLFPQVDQSCIYAKSWNADGTIKTVRYIPEINNAPIIDNVTPDINDILQDIMDRLERIEKNTSYRRKPYNQHKNSPQQSGTEESNE